MAKCRFIFFDVGNTLLFPNRARMLAPLPEDRHPTLATWQSLERRTKHEFDQGLAEIDQHADLVEGLDAFHQRALEILRSNRTRSAFDLNREQGRPVAGRVDLTTIDSLGLKVGDRFEVIPAHCCATMNLHRTCVAVRQGRVEAAWPIEASGRYD